MAMDNKVIIMYASDIHPDRDIHRKYHKSIEMALISSIKRKLKI